MKKITGILILSLIFWSGCLSTTTAPEKSGGNIAESEKTTGTAPRVKAGNLLEDPGFEEGPAGWGPFGDCSVVLSEKRAHKGGHSLFTSGRTANWNGPAINLTQICLPGDTYAISLWISLENSQAAKVNASVKQVDDKGTNYAQAATMEISGQNWTLLTGEYAVKANGEIQELTLYIEGPEAGVNYFIDDVEVKSLTAGETGDTEEPVVSAKLPATPLKELGSRHNLVIGAAATAGGIKFPQLTGILGGQFASITAENEMKMYVIGRDEGKYFFDTADALMDFATANNLMMRGHTLVWHNNSPKYLEKDGWTKESVLNFLKEYITTVMSRYKGKIYCWDVINEAFLSEGQFRQGDTSVWFRYTGTEYIEKAFIWAHEIDPDCKLFINDYGVAEINAKSTAIYNLCKELLAKGVPIHGFGIQMHLIEESAPDYRSIYENIKRFKELGMEVHITEMDVRIKKPVTPAKLKNQATIYKNIVQIALAMDNVTNLTTWGFTDALSWIPAYDNAYDAALIFDEELNPKPSYFALHETLEKGPQPLKFPSEASRRNDIPPFKARKAKALPQIDGKMTPGEWENAVIYPFAFNQLSFEDLTLPESDNLKADWRILYNGNRIYGLVQRQDDVTQTEAVDSWENDNLEVFFDIDGKYVQLRSVAGSDFESNAYTGSRKIVWSSKGDIIEFVVELPPEELEGTILGWNIALSDNDQGMTRDAQVYPINGQNKGYMGKDYGEIEFIDPEEKGKRLGKAHIVMPFKVALTDQAPQIDGKGTPEEWEPAVIYSFAFNQLDSEDLSPPAPEDLSGTWRLMYAGNTLYGLVTRVDDKTVTNAPDPRENDGVEICIELSDEFIALRANVGKGFEKAEYKGKIQSAWSADGNTLEFSVELPEKELSAVTGGWNISLADNDGGKTREHHLYPVTGTDQSFFRRELGEILFD